MRLGLKVVIGLESVTGSKPLGSYIGTNVIS